MMTTAQLLAQRVAAEYLAAASSANGSKAQSTEERLRHAAQAENGRIIVEKNDTKYGAQVETAAAPAPAGPTSAYSLAMLAAQSDLEASSSSPAHSSSQVPETHVGASVMPDTSAESAAPSGAHALAMLAAQGALEDSSGTAHMAGADHNHSSVRKASQPAVSAEEVQQMAHEAQLRQVLIEGELQPESELDLNDACPTSSEKRHSHNTKHMRRRPRRSSDYITDHPSSHGKPLTISTKTASSSKYTGNRRFSQNDALDMSSDEELSVSDISTASRTSRSNSQSMSRTSSLSGNLSGSKRPSTESLSVTGHLQRVLGTTSDGSGSSCLGGRHTLSRTMSSKCSRGSLRSFRSNLGMVGENSTLLSSHDASNGTKSNADWNFATQPATHHPSNSHLLHPRAGSSAGLHRPPSSTAMGGSAGGVRSMLLEHARQESNRSLMGGSNVSGTPAATGMNATMSVQDILLNQEQHMSSYHRNMSGLGVGGAPSHSSMANAGNRNMSHTAMSSSNALTSLASRNSMTSNASGPVSAPKPNNPFLGGGSTSAAANFLSLMGPAATPAVPPAKMSTPRQVSASGPSGTTTQMAKMHGLSGATQDFLSLLQQPAGIGSVQALIQSQNGQARSPKGGNEVSTVSATPVQPESIQIPSIVGTCRGSTPRKIDGGIKVKDDGAVVNGQTASEGHQAQTHSKDPSNMSPQELLVATIEARGGDGTIRPVLSAEDKFHTHTDEEIAAYPPTAILVRNNDLAGLKMAHQSGGKLQTSNKFGESLLHIACRRGYDHIASYLIEEADVTVWVRDDFGRTPCHDACWTAKPNLELMDLLVKKCPEMLLMSDKRGSTPLDYVRRDNWDIWRKFLEDRWDIVIPKKA